MKQRTLTRSPEETMACAAEFARYLKAGDIVFLQGELGSGKTEFTRGIARALNIVETITSPTFSLAEIYTGGELPLYHFDLYRLNDPAELANLFFEEYWHGNGVSVIEWPEKGARHIPAADFRVSIKVTENSERSITIESIDH